MPKTYTFTEVRGLNAMLRSLPREAQSELRDASKEIAAGIASKARAKATGLGGVAKHVAPTIRATRDRVPVVRMGGSQRLPAWPGRPRRGSRQTVGDIMYGAEFGSRRYPQFPPVTRPGRFLWRVVEDESSSITDAYGDALMRAVDKAAR